MDKFKKEYKGKYSEEFPYATKAGSKYGYQFRIYLSDTEECPDFFENYLDKKYGNRINDNRSIAEIVKEYEFQFTKAQQNSERILECVRDKAGTFENDYQKGYQVYANFLQTLSDKMNDNAIPKASIVHPKVGVKKHSRRKKNNSGIIKIAFITEQLFRLGWLGELYVYKLLSSKDEALLDALQIYNTDLYDVVWHNEGATESEKWDDKSVGKGCDIELVVNKKLIYIEVKASKRKNGLFVMTLNEMHDEDDRYYIIKIDWLERLLENESSEMYVFSLPYNLFFKPEKMKEATFRIEGESDE